MNAWRTGASADRLDDDESGPDEARVHAISDHIVCPNCETANAAGRKFCRRCGQELHDGAAGSQAPATGLEAATTASAADSLEPAEAKVGRLGGRGTPTIVVSVVAIGFIALVGIFLVMAFTGGSGDAPTPAQTTAGASLDPSPSASALPTEGSTAVPVPEPVPVPVPEPEPTATAKATERPAPNPTRAREPTARQAIENDLLARASFVKCEPWRKPKEQPFVFGAEGAIRCGRPAARISQLAMYAFPDPDTLADFWPVRLDGIDPRPPETGSACDGGEQGVRTWGNGHIACWLDDHGAKIRWTDDRTDMFGGLNADQDLANLYAWWRTNGRRLGRPLADAPSGPATGATAQPVADGPGQPSSFVCDGVTRIEDPLGRRWLVTSVQFLNQSGSERVIYKMELDDSESGFPGSTVAVDAFPIGDPEGHLARLERPDAGDSVVRVTMGTEVNDATRLRHHRPKGVQVVKDLSMYRLDNGTTVSVIGVTGEGCYRVRVPAWESPSGDQATAEIHLDIQP
jgi:hypothetical protein